MVKKRLSTEARKERTLTRVAEVFAAKGFTGTTSAELAAAAGVSEAMLYKLFGSKRGLYQAMIQHKIAANGWGELPVEAHEGSVESFFTHMARAIFTNVERDPDFVRLLLFSDLQGSAFAHMFHETLCESVVASVSAFIRARAERGELRALDPDVSAAAFLCMAWQYAVSAKIFKVDRLPPVSDDQLIHTLVTLFLHGLTAQPGSPP